MKSYLKSFTKSLYQKVQRAVQDEYIQPISETEIYAIINRKRPYSSQSRNNPKSFLHSKESIDSQEILDNIERLALVTPERQFRLIGDSYSVEVISYRMKELKTKMEALKQHMMENYPSHLQAIQTALLQIQNIKNLSSTRQKSLILKQRLSKLQNLVIRTKKITELNIKLKNIKQTLKLAQKIPNIKKMSLFELKNINLQKINQFKQSLHLLYPSSQQKQLHCIQHLQYFIDKVAGENLRVIVADVTYCLTECFSNAKYEKAIKGFVISRSDLEYQKLLVRLVETEVRDKVQEEAYKSQQKNSLVFRCKKYITVLINLSKLFRWHRYNSAVVDSSSAIEQKIRARNNSATSNCSQRSQEKHIPINLDSEVSIKLHTEELKTHTCQLMDQCLKQQLEEMLFNNDLKNEQIFEILALVNSFFQVAFSFSSFVFEESRILIREILMRKCYKLHEKGIKDLSEALMKEEEDEWNRLPVVKNFRYKPLERTLSKMRKIHGYEKIPTLIPQNFKFLNIEQTASPQQVFQLLAAHQTQHSSLQLQQIQIPYQKFQKPISSEINQSPLPEHQDPQVVICRSSLTILSYLQQLSSIYFYFPIQELRKDILGKMAFYLDFYVFYLFHVFLSDMYKKLFFENAETLEQVYLKVRVRSLYQEIHHFLERFKEDSLKHHGHKSGQEYENGQKFVNGTSHNNKKESIEMNKYKTSGHGFINMDIKPSKVSSQNSVKARAVATDSIKFLIAYYQHTLTHLQKYTTSKTSKDQDQQQKQSPSPLENHLTTIQSYKTLYNQLSDLLLTDITSNSTKIDFVIPIMKKIKWHQVQNTKEVIDYGSVILKSVKQTYDKMKGMSKGQIPFYLLDKIFSFYWKTQLTFITKVFLQEHVASKQKGGKGAKIAFEILIDYLYEELEKSLNTKPKSTKQLSSSSLHSISSSTSLPSPSYTTTRTQLFRNSYLKIKNIFPMLFENNWRQCQYMVSQSMKNFQFIYKIEILIMRASQSCSGLSPAEMEERVKEIDEFIRLEIVKDLY